MPPYLLKAHACLLALVIAVMALPAQAGVPGTLDYRGQLSSAGGVPVNGAVSIAFKL